MVVAGGVEGHIDSVPIASFAMMRAMSTRNDDPAYFYKFSVSGYAIGINVLLYAMTH